jgi:hypothetical protein
MANSASSNDFIIWGPAVSVGAAALNAVHALYYLPSRFKLMLPAARPEDKDSYQQVESLISRDGLEDRVTFTAKQVDAAWQAVIVADADDHCPGHIFARSPEALASAILDVSRAAA